MIWFLIIWTLATLGFFSLASSMSKHQKQIFAKELTLQQTRLATTVGWLLLIVSLLICLTQRHWSTEISYWVGVITFAALFVGLCLSYFEQKIKNIAVSVLLLFIFSLTLHLI
ncbi:DUF3325 domain-containing protein [Acinetobacter johnsonii]|jgi:hypothetical protein|uniref:DUF3325 domain-containing protein n=1 Tax=Acinetobacter johnsonii TaxID=40214 RepID=UPI00244D65E3|nr:DUF3325 domain-containing protein [Acinetobacter johnsonii]MDH1705744.1 DUF3325 domain-containing protein [Acinetobacter johnsonii]